MTARTLRGLLAGLVVVALAATGLVWRAQDDPQPATARGAAGPTPRATPTEQTTGQSPGQTGEGIVSLPDLEMARSVTREDSYYPDAGDPGIDSLHHDLVLAWDPDDETLTATDTLAFRVTADADEFRLDLGEPLEVASTVLDGEEVPHEHTGKDLVVQAQVQEGSEHVVEIAYSGTPEPVPAPTTRQDFSTVGWTVTTGGEVWTMQEPFGAYTWYPVNDQPADKALYDFTITAPAPFVGIANGTLESRIDGDLGTTTRWHTDEPMSSYLTTIAIGDYVTEEQVTDSGVPVSLWVPRDKQAAMAKVRYAREAIEWIESKLGPYPFSSAGIVVTDSRSGMETQTMVTLGDDDYVLSKKVIVHEMVHQWYGDQVTPTDWRDVWMNEGMTMYLQALYESEHGGPSMKAAMARYAAADGFLREQAGPPGDYDPGTFGEGNIYYIPAVMWDELRQRIGDDAFWSMVRSWPTVHDNSGATREDYLDWVEQTTGEELSGFFDAWLNGDSTPSTT
ncbi:MAG: M1 family metallopeptidase [Nocardioides sp.]